MSQEEPLNINEYRLECSILFNTLKKANKYTTKLKCTCMCQSCVQKNIISYLTLQILSHNYKYNDNVTGMIYLKDYTNQLIISTRIIISYEYDIKKIMFNFNI